MAQQYIFQMESLTKKIRSMRSPQRYLALVLSGAKIGVLGRNGSGKSTLLRIMAGMDKTFEGTAKLMLGFTVGILEQEPHLNPDKDVFGNVEEAVASTRALPPNTRSCPKSWARLPTPTKWEAARTGKRKCKTRSSTSAGNSTGKSKIAMDAMNRAATLTSRGFRR